MPKKENGCMGLKMAHNVFCPKFVKIQPEGESVALGIGFSNSVIRAFLDYYRDQRASNSGTPPPDLSQREQGLLGNLAVVQGLKVTLNYPLCPWLGFLHRQPDHMLAQANETETVVVNMAFKSITLLSVYTAIIDGIQKIRKLIIKSINLRAVS